MFESLASCFAFRCSAYAQHDSAIGLLGGNPCGVPWTTFARHVLFWLLHAEILHQDLWLPDE
jgi:hypothetical protein